MNKVNFPKVLIGERITLNAYANGDIKEQSEKMFDIINRNRDFFIPWHKDTTGNIKYQNPEMCADYITRIVNAFNNQTQAGYGIYFKETNQYIGHIMAIEIDYQNNSVEFGRFIDKNFAKNGYMKEANLLLEDFFIKQGAHHFTLKCAGDNENAKKSHEKLNYNLEGIQKENRLYIGDTKYRDTYIYGKIINNQK
ncbi:GNAT family N-acetyltransferase [bacterium]|nr:GNAT family N-acetyltransferase [bacterium]